MRVTKQKIEQKKDNMGLHLKVEKRAGEKTKKILQEAEVIDFSRRVLREESALFFPIKKKFKDVPKNSEFVGKKDSPAKIINQAPAELLKGKLSEEELALVPTSFEIIGDILILELDEALGGKEKEVGTAFLLANRNVKTVLKKTSKRKGEFRTRDFAVIAGEDKLETIHKEHGCEFALNVSGSYFSPREAMERQRVSKKIGKNESVLVMFSGISPFGIVIAKENPDAKVVCIEKNPEAVTYANKNVRINKVFERVDNICGDVRKIAEKYKKEGVAFDRIFMPLPKGAHEFLNVTIPIIKSGGVLHFYSWAREEDLFTDAEKRIKSAVEKESRKMKIIEKKKVLPYAPRTWKIVLDVEIK